MGGGNVIRQDFDSTSVSGMFLLNGAYRLSSQWKVSAGVDYLISKTYQEHLNAGGGCRFVFPGDRALNEPGRTLWTKVDFSF